MSGHATASSAIIEAHLAVQATIRSYQVGTALWRSNILRLGCNIFISLCRCEVTWRPVSTPWAWTTWTGRRRGRWSSAPSPWTRRWQISARVVREILLTSLISHITTKHILRVAQEFSKQVKCEIVLWTLASLACNPKPRGFTWYGTSLNIINWMWQMRTWDESLMQNECCNLCKLQMSESVQNAVVQMLVSSVLSSCQVWLLTHCGTWNLFLCNEASNYMVT